jgi:hypothetical protein
MFDLGSVAFIVNSPIDSNIIETTPHETICAFIIVNSNSSYETFKHGPPESFFINAIGRNFAHPTISSDLLTFDSYIINRHTIVRIYTVPLIIHDVDIFDIKVLMQSMYELLTGKVWITIGCMIRKTLILKSRITKLILEESII